LEVAKSCTFANTVVAHRISVLPGKIKLVSRRMIVIIVRKLISLKCLLRTTSANSLI